MKKRIAWWDWLTAIGLGLLLIWIILKAMGIIHSPMWVDMIPYLGIFVAITGAIYKLGRVMEVIEQTSKKVDRLLSLETRFNKLEAEHCLVMAGKMKAGH